MRYLQLLKKIGTKYIPDSQLLSIFPHPHYVPCSSEFYPAVIEYRQYYDGESI